MDAYLAILHTAPDFAGVRVWPEFVDRYAIVDTAFYVSGFRRANLN